jgi:hypothetical protein
MESRSTRLMLLGIGILLFSVAFPLQVNVRWLLPSGDMIFAILPLVGLVFVLVGLFTKDQS